MSEQLQSVLDRLENVTGSNGKFSARCPCHEDNTNSLCIGTGDDGRVLMKCQANCKTKDILSVIGLSWSDLFADEQTSGNGKPEIVAEYNYKDEIGQLLFQAVRYRGKGFKQRKPNPSGGWEWKLNGVRRVLYRLPELLEADPRQTVFIVEGEKDCDRLRSLGLVATCNVGGAGKWKKDYNGPLVGRPVVIIPDNDDPGRKHVQQVARLLHSTADSVRVLELPGLPKSGDVSDFLNNGGSKEELLRLVENVPAWKPTRQTANARGQIDTLSIGNARRIYKRTDMGNADRFVDQHGENVRYCFPWSTVGD